VGLPLFPVKSALSLRSDYMNKKIIGAVIAAVVLLGAFAACSDEPQDVNVVDYDLRNAKQVTDLNVNQVGSNYYLIFTWTAVDNGSGYKLYYKEEGKKTVKEFQQPWGYSNSTVSAKSPVAGRQGPAGLEWTRNTDVDKYNLNVDVQYTVTTTYTGIGAPAPDIDYNGELPPGTYRFGIKTYDVRERVDPSDIKWSKPITVAAPAGVTYTTAW